MTEQELRNKVVSIATEYIGCKESDGSHKKIIDLYNSYTPLARSYKVKYTDAWCSTFASAVAIKANLTDIIPTECGCEKHIELFKKIGSWQENDAYVPKAGDYIFYDWQDNGVGDNVGSADHVGIVEKVVGSTITVIEGNYNDMVKRRTIQVNGRYIRGYGVPNYSKKASSLSLGSAASTTDTQGTNSSKNSSNSNSNSSASSNSSSSSVKIDHAKSFNSSIAGSYKVKTDLNLRSGAGTSKSIVVVMPGSTKVQNYGYYTEIDGTKWLYVQTKVGGKEYIGFCSSKYLNKV